MHTSHYLTSTILTHASNNLISQLIFYHITLHFNQLITLSPITVTEQGIEQSFL